MDDFLVKDLMVPISEYATVPEGATLMEAVLALEKAQEEFDHTHYRHRAVLVLDTNNRVTGKLGQLDLLCALEPIEAVGGPRPELHRFGFSSKLIRKIRDQNRRMDIPLKQVCSEIAQLSVAEFMQAPKEGECVEGDVSLEVAITQLVSGHHLSLLVTLDKEIVGILRSSDVFAAVFHVMKECEVSV